MNARIFSALFFILSVCVWPATAQKTTAAPKTVSAGIVNSKALDLPKPEYPAAAQAIRAKGEVKVQVTIDEKGNVVSAEAVSGHPLLRAASEKAAQAAKFSPTLLSGKPVKVTGVIIYNFVEPSPRPNYEEELRTIALGVLLTAHEEMEITDKDLEEMFGQFPAYYPEIKPLSPAKGAFPQRRTALINEAVSALRSGLSGSQAWQFELGENLGALVVKLRKYEKSDLKDTVDAAALRADLDKIRRLTDAAPADIQVEVLEKIKDLGNAAGTETLGGEELLAVVAIKLIKLINTVSPD